MSEVLASRLPCLSRSGFHHLSYRTAGPAHPVPVVCLHGLGRNARDFDNFATALAVQGRRVVSLDVVGRGESEWLRDPQDYGYPQYLADTAALIARLDARQVDIVGTSMGGLIGMMLAAQPGNPIRHLVVNDVGPFIPKAALQRILEYFGKNPYFPDLEAAEAYHRATYASFGNLTDSQWRRLTETSLRRDGEGWRLHYDPQIAEPWAGVEIEDVDLWPVWDIIACPVLALRGATSDLLLSETAAEMARRGPKAQVIEFSGCGHAPALLEPDQIDPIAAWLNKE